MCCSPWGRRVGHDWVTELNWLIIVFLMLHIPFPHSSVGKESTCDAGDPGSIPGLGRSAGEGIGYPLQYSLASLVAQLVKNPPAMWEVRSLGWEDPLEKGKAAHSSNLAWRIPWKYKSMGLQRVGHSWATFTHSLTHIPLILTNLITERLYLLTAFV